MAIKSIYKGYASFLGDVEKMHDFITMSMEDFLNMYSYLNEKDYYATYDELMNISREECERYVSATTGHEYCVECETCKYRKVCGADVREEPCLGYDCDEEMWCL